MTKAKDTVMRDFDKTRVYYPGEVEVKLEIQAEVSFKVGQESREWVRERLNTITCMENYADQDKAITSLIFELKEWG